MRFAQRRGKFVAQIDNSQRKPRRKSDFEDMAKRLAKNAGDTEQEVVNIGEKLRISLTNMIWDYFSDAASWRSFTLLYGSSD